MGKSSKVVCSVVAMLMIMLWGVTLMGPAGVSAQPTLVPVEGVSYNVGASMADNLKSLTGKRVEVALDSGKTFTGTIKVVGDHLVHLEKMEGKEYFDALIRIENINAIDTRFRKDQR